VFSQVLNVLFLVLVEVPHMRKLYEKKVRDESPVPRAIIKALPAQVKQQRSKMEKTVQQSAKKIKQKALKELYDLYKKGEVQINNIRQKMKADKAAKNAAAGNPDNGTSGSNDKEQPEATITIHTERIFIGDPLEVTYETQDNHSETDWLGVYPADPDRIDEHKKKISEHVFETIPGQSDGKWVYVPAGARGIVRIPPSLLPNTEGVYEVRYHADGLYKVLDQSVFRIESPYVSYLLLLFLSYPLLDWLIIRFHLCYNSDDKERKSSDEDASLAAPARKAATTSSH
jgi:hypothetical protein